MARQNRLTRGAEASKDTCLVLTQERRRRRWRKSCHWRLGQRFLACLQVQGGVGRWHFRAQVRSQCVLLEPLWKDNGGGEENLVVNVIEVVKSCEGWGGGGMRGLGGRKRRVNSSELVWLLLCGIGCWGYVEDSSKSKLAGLRRIFRGRSSADRSLLRPGVTFLSGHATPNTM